MPKKHQNIKTHLIIRKLYIGRIGFFLTYIILDTQNDSL